jgi:hypothetical protein
VVGDNVQFIESTIDKSTFMQSQASVLDDVVAGQGGFSGFWNTLLLGGVMGGQAAPSMSKDSGYIRVYAGGIWTNGINTVSTITSGWWFDGDAIIAGTATNQTYITGVNMWRVAAIRGQLNVVSGGYLELGGSILSVLGGIDSVAYGANTGIGGGFNVVGSGQINIPPGKTFANSIPIAAFVKFNGLTTACNSCGATTQTVTCGISSTAAAFDGACDATHFGGFGKGLGVGGGGYVSQLANPLPQ